MDANDIGAREKEVLDYFEETLESIREKGYHSTPAPLSSDATENFLELIRREVKELEENVNAYEENGNSTETYQKLKCESSQLVVNLDNVDLRGRDKLGKERKSLLMRIEAAMDTLQGKAIGNVKPYDGGAVGTKPVFNIKIYESDKNE